ncbi:MAG: alginate export family protein [bacterium]|nr:alginate export family protein [bacterium]
MSRKLGIGVLLVAGLALAPVIAHGELQSVQVGGSIEIYGNYYTEFWEANATTRIPADFLPGRAIGPFGTLSAIRSDDQGDALSWVEQRTALNVTATFTDDVCVFIELDSIDTWGEDFRSNYVTGADSRANSVDDVEVYQAYINVDNFLVDNVSLRVGRQEILLGGEWLVGNNSTFDPLTYLSFDAVRLSYAIDILSVDAFWAKVAERSPAEEDGDTDLYGVYATFKGIENIDIDAYWMLLRDGQSLNDTNFIAPLEWVEDVLNLDDYDVTNVHTAGLRVAGALGGLDFELEGAYQWGDASTTGAGFVPFLYGDDNATYDTFAAHATLGYTFDVMWSPRVYIGGAYYGGEDERDLTFLEWINPFHRTDASVSFNRLFSSTEADWFFDGGALSNAWIAQAGFTVQPTEALEVGFDALYFEALEPFDAPATFRLGKFYVPMAPALAFWTEEAEKDLGVETILWVSYAYSEDLSFEAGWAHLFVGEALEKGAFSGSNGLEFLGGRDSDDADYFYLGTKIVF